MPPFPRPVRPAPPAPPNYPALDAAALSDLYDQLTPEQQSALSWQAQWFSQQPAGPTPPQAQARPTT